MSAASHLEADQIRFLELHDTEACSRGPQHRPAIRGECLLHHTGSAPVGFAYEQLCGRLVVTVVGEAGQPLAGATVTLRDALGEPVPV